MKAYHEKGSDFKQPQEWVQHNRKRAEAIPTTCAFTGAAITASGLDPKTVIQPASRKGVVEKCGSVTFDYVLEAGEGRRTTRHEANVWQITPPAWDALKQIEAQKDEPSTLPCGHDGFKNVGTVEGAPSDEPYMACTHCEQMFPRSQLE